MVTAFINFMGTFTYWQKEYPTIAQLTYGQDLVFSLFTSLIPILGFLFGLINTDFYKHGFKLK